METERFEQLPLVKSNQNAHRNQENCPFTIILNGLHINYPIGHPARVHVTIDVPGHAFFISDVVLSM